MDKELKEASKTEELKPCPFCGNTEIVFLHGNKDREGIPCACMCDNCSAVGPLKFIQENGESIVIKAWNGRA